MKKNLCILILLLTVLSGYAQDGKNNDRREQIEALRIGYFTTELSLSVEQSQKFWPLFNEYCDQRREQHKRGRKLFDKIKCEEVGLQEANEWIAIQEELVAINKKFQPQFLEILSPTQLARMYAADEGFKQELLRSTYKRRDK